MPTETTTTTPPQTETARPGPGAPKSPTGPRLRFDDAVTESSYVNYANATSTREETTLVFGMIQAFNQAGNEVPVKINHRIIMSPFVARRLSKMLINLLQNYETQFGPLPGDGQ